jgi:hypothetical protein
MKFKKIDIEKPITVKLDKTFKTENGLMIYGEENAYPQIIERLVLKSQTASAAVRVLASFIAGSGFENESIGDVVVGKDIRGKRITLNKVRNKIAQSIAMYNGVYVHANFNLSKQVTDTRVLPFKDYRFSKQDDRGYCSKIGYHNNWEKDGDKEKFKSNDVSWFNTFNPDAVLTNIEHSGGVEKYKGQIFHEFVDDSFIYPLSPFDSVANDMDTEYQVQLFKNREIRNGFSDKIVMNIAEGVSEEEFEDRVNEIKNSMGPGGSKFILFETKFNEDGQLEKDGSFRLDKIETNINDKLFENWETRISNSIRKAAYNMPAILIDYQQGTLSAASGEAITEAFDVYNKYTKQLREKMSEILKDIYSYHVNDTLRNNDNWNILQL